MNICGFEFEFQPDGFRLLYSGIAVFMWLMTLLFSKEYMKHYEHKKRYYVFMLLTFGATVGVLLSSELLTTFVFFEIMSFTSYVLVIHDETKEALRAGETYLAVAVIGGMVMLMGLFLLYDALGSLRAEELYGLAQCYEDKGRLYLAGALILVGFGAKAGMFPLHIWLPKAHPIAPAPASALLSGILTKSGIFGAIVISCNLFRGDGPWGNMLVLVGAVTMVLGAVLALFSVNLKRTLACSSVSQIGFITLGLGFTLLLGEENALAARGTMLHMVNHSLIKLLLFMAAGVIYMNIHKLDLNQIRGYGRRKPALAVLFFAGAASISGVPLTSGYVSKTLLHEAILEYIAHGEHLGHSMAAYSALEWVFLVTGGITFAYMLKLFICIFVERNADEAVQEMYDSNTHCMSKLSTLCLAAPAVVMAVFGALPNATMDRLADYSRAIVNGGLPAHAVHYFSLVNLSGSLTSLAIGLAIYLLIVRTVLMSSDGTKKAYAQKWPKLLDLEELLYRPIIALLLRLVGAVCSVLSSVGDCSVKFILWFGGIICTYLADISDSFLSMLGIHLLRQIKPHEERFSPMTWIRNNPMYVSWQNKRDSVTQLTQTMSFGLLMAVIGLCVFLIYLL